MLDVRDALWLGRLCCFFPGGQEKVADAAEDSLPQETHEQDEDHAEPQLPARAELQRSLQEILKEEPDRRANERAEKRAATADGRLHDELTGSLEREGLWRHECLHHAEQA